MKCGEEALLDIRDQSLYFLFDQKKRASKMQGCGCSKNTLLLRTGHPQRQQRS
jgi:hypothetical protein